MGVKTPTGIGKSGGVDAPAYYANSSAPVAQSTHPNHYVARTALGRKLVELRRRAIQSGMTLIGAEEVAEEVARNRGELR